MKAIPSIDLVLESQDPIIVTKQDHGEVWLHGYAYSENCGTWAIHFRPCEKHIAALEEAVRILKERMLEMAAKNGNHVVTGA